LTNIQISSPERAYYKNVILLNHESHGRDSS
jgi:hypothetical protein